MIQIKTSSHGQRVDRREFSVRLLDELVERLDQHLGIANFSERFAGIAKLRVFLFSSNCFSPSSARASGHTARSRFNRLRTEWIGSLGVAGSVFDLLQFFLRFFQL